MFHEKVELHVTVHFFHELRETVLFKRASAGQVPSAEAILCYHGGSVTQCWSDYVLPLMSTSIWEYSKEKRVTKL